MNILVSNNYWTFLETLTFVNDAWDPLLWVSIPLSVVKSIIIGAGIKSLGVIIFPPATIGGTLEVRASSSDKLDLFAIKGF